ncbi:MAG: hypothetical protein QOI29_3872 [Mycobacterium sp.]|nr:hypothetical protein [Mycobacterium sp.]
MLPRTNFGSASVDTPSFGKLAESPGPFITGVVSCAESVSRMPSRMFSTRRTPIGLDEQVLPACAAFVFDHALISTCKFACSTSRSTGTPQR